MKLWKITFIAAWLCLVGMFLAVVFAENMGLGFIFLMAFFPLMIFSGIAKSKKETKACRDDKKTKRILDKTPVAAELVSIQEKIRGGTAVGALTGGIPGAVLCAYLSKERATFLVRYASGRTSVETVIVNSARFKELSAFLKK